MDGKRRLRFGRIGTNRMNWGLALAVIIISLQGFAFSFLDEEKKPSFYRAAVGQAVVFNCHIEFPHDVPIPYILNWNKEGQTIFSSYESTVSAKGSYKGRIKLLPSNSGFGKGSINVTNIRETDGGWYECQVTYPNRSPTRHQNGTWFHLKVDGGNVIATPPINQTTVEGETAKFPCVTKENSSTVMWKKDGVRLSNRNHNFPVRYTLNSQGTLTISPTEMDDLGEFTCEATDSKGEKQSASAFLNVQYKAKVIQAPREIYLPFGRSAVVDCHFRANPPLMKLRWEKDGFLFDPYNVQGVVYKSNGSLFFEEVKDEHGGVYTCTPFNELGTEGPSPKMNVVVLKPPTFTVTPQMLYIRRKGETIHIPCDATEEHGVHKPNIEWLKDGEPISKDKFKPTEGNLTISELREDDRGIYQCVASNAVTSISAETELMIENTAPRAPYNVRADSTDDSITVKWKSGLTKPQLEFSVWYRIVDSAVWKFLPALPSDINEVTIPNLPSGTDYEVMVLRQDLYGDGMFSKSIKIRTKGEPDYSAVEKSIRGSFNTGADCEEKSPNYGAESFNRFRNSVDGVKKVAHLQAKPNVEPPKNINVHFTPKGWMLTWDAPDAGAENFDHYALEWKKNGEILSAVTEDNFYLVKDPIRGETYTFQVFRVAKDNTESVRATLVMHVPSDQRAKAITLGVSLGFVILIVTVLLSWFVHKHFSQKT